MLKLFNKEEQVETLERKDFLIIEERNEVNVYKKMIIDSIRKFPTNKDTIDKYPTNYQTETLSLILDTKGIEDEIQENKDLFSIIIGESEVDTSVLYSEIDEYATHERTLVSTEYFIRFIPVNGNLTLNLYKNKSGDVAESTYSECLSEKETKELKRLKSYLELMEFVEEGVLSIITKWLEHGYVGVTRGGVRYLGLSSGTPKKRWLFS